MKNKFRDRGFFLLAVSFFLLICRNQGFSADYYIGFNYGYSAALIERHYDEYSGVFTSPRLKTCQRFYAQFFPKESKIGFSFEVFKQAYDEVMHSTINGIEKGSTSYPTDFIYFMIGADYRFFADKDKKFNPYLNLSLMATYFWFNLLFGIHPSYPNAYDLKFGAGIKYKLVRGILLNANLSYFVGNSILSLQAGLEFAFDKFW